MLTRGFGVDSNSPGGLPKPSPAPGGATSEMGAPSAASDAPSVIGADLSVVGEGLTIICRSKLIIAGEVTGDINGDWITVAKTGKVQGTIAARAVSVYGRVIGAIRATTVTLQATARVDGDILQMDLVVTEGAHFEGRVQRAQSEAELEPMLEVPDRAAS